MNKLRLPKLPDRTPVKFSITVGPQLAHALRDYRDLYQATYGTAEDITELIPYMLAAFLESDAGFKKTRRERRGSAADLGRDQTAAVRPQQRPGSPSVFGEPSA